LNPSLLISLVRFSWPSLSRFGFSYDAKVLYGLIIPIGAVEKDLARPKSSSSMQSKVYIEKP
jgi:hypothetical protein